ncbi:MAG: hypothetical protein KDA68_04300 [Planctomycetaceae bacterium]|nr:hypothetical protein [Planctomycetaceae bacterium]
MDDLKIEYSLYSDPFTHYYLSLPDLLPSICPFGASFWNNDSGANPAWPNCLSTIYGPDIVQSDRVNQLPNPDECLENALFIFTFSGQELTESGLRILKWIRQNQGLLRDNLLASLENSVIIRPRLPDDDDLYDFASSLPVSGPARTFVGNTTELITFYLPRTSDANFGVEVSCSPYWASIGVLLSSNGTVNDVGWEDTAYVH